MSLGTWLVHHYQNFNFNNIFTGIPLLLRIKKFKLYAVMGKKIMRSTLIKHIYKAPIQHKTLKHLLKSIHINGNLVQVEEVRPQCLLSVCGVICLSYTTELLSLKLKGFKALCRADILGMGWLDFSCSCKRIVLIIWKYPSSQTKNRGFIIWCHLSSRICCLLFSASNLIDKLFKSCWNITIWYWVRIFYGYFQSSISCKHDLEAELCI